MSTILQNSLCTAYLPASGKRADSKKAKPRVPVLAAHAAAPVSAGKRKSAGAQPAARPRSVGEKQQKASARTRHERNHYINLPNCVLLYTKISKILGIPRDLYQVYSCEGIIKRVYRNEPDYRKPFCYLIKTNGQFFNLSPNKILCPKVDCHVYFVIIYIIDNFSLQQINITNLIKNRHRT